MLFTFFYIHRVPYKLIVAFSLLNKTRVVEKATFWHSNTEICIGHAT